MIQDFSITNVFGGEGEYVNEEQIDQSGKFPAELILLFTVNLIEFVTQILTSTWDFYLTKPTTLTKLVVLFRLWTKMVLKLRIKLAETLRKRKETKRESTILMLLSLQQ